MQNSINVDVGAAIRKAEAEVQRFKDIGDEILVRSSAETRDLTKDEQAKIAEAQDGMVAARKRIDVLRGWVESAASQAKPDNAPTGDGKARAATRSYETFVRRNGGILVDKANETPEQAEQREAFERWFRSGQNDAALRALSTNFGNQGAFTIPTSFANAIERRMLDYSGVLGSPVTVLTTSTGEDIQYPTVDDTSNTGADIEEVASASETQEPSFGQYVLRAFNGTTGAIRVPNQLLQDSGVSMETLLVDMLAERAGRRMNDKLTTGTGNNQPMGIVTAATASSFSTATSTTISDDNLIDLEHSVDRSYRSGSSVGWQMHDLTMKALKKLKDADGRALWQDAYSASLAQTTPGFLKGYPVFINQSMTPIGTTGAKVVLFGDHSKYYVRRVGQVAIGRSNDLGLLNNTTIFVGFYRYDGRLLQPQAIKSLANA